ncbi:amino acid permease [Crocinitomicaceae bacterium]|nr:amino acid permease [Crocinitomicaceae bacterium]MDB3907145.1 amino acid permease [Crocinitomicaceae bacterium]
MKKSLSTTHILLYGVGTMLGAGIYVLVGKVAGYAGSLAPLSFLIAGVLAGLTAYSYSLLAPRFPKSGGEIEYVRAATRSKRLASLVGWGVIFTGFISAAAIAKGFVGYLDVFIEFPDWMVIIAITFLLSAIAIWGIGQSMVVIGVITLIEVGGLIFIISASGVSPSEIGDRFSELFISSPDHDILAVFQGAFLAFYAFVGFEDLANVAEEAKNPKKSMPVALLGGLCIALALYILVAVLAVVALPLDVLSSTDAPMAEILAHKGESYIYFITLISLIAVINGVLAQIIMGSRVLFGMARHGSAPSFLNKVHQKYQTPVSATVLMAIIIVILAIAVPITNLANATSYVIISVFVLVNFSQVILIYKDRKSRMYRTIKFWLPFFGGVLCLVFLLYKTLTLV